MSATGLLNALCAVGKEQLKMATACPPCRDGSEQSCLATTHIFSGFSDDDGEKLAIVPK